MKIGQIELGEWQQVHSHLWQRDDRFFIGNWPEAEAGLFFQPSKDLWLPRLQYALSEYWSLYPHIDFHFDELELAKAHMDRFLERLSKLQVML